MIKLKRKSCREYKRTQKEWNYVPVNRKWKDARAPTAIPLTKAKTLLAEQEFTLKGRPLISQFRHPLAKNLRIASCALKALQRVW